MDGAPFGILPSETEFVLRLAIFKKLQLKYSPHFGAQATFLCGGIINHALILPAGNQEAKRFCELNRNLIEQQARSLHLDVELSYAVSLLYALTILILGPKDPERLMSLAERATELHIPLLSASEIYVTEDASELLAFFREYADELMKAE